MDLRVLEYFLAVAEEENISHAAENLHVSQPTVSRQLMELEKEIGRKLFERTNKKVILTEDGLLFRQTAKDILQLYSKAVSGYDDKKELEGDLYIIAAEIESFEIIAEKIREFHEQYPKVLIHIHSGNAEEISAAIDNGTADIGFFVQSVNTMKYEVFNLNILEEWGIIVRRGHRLADREFVTADDLRKEKLIVPENNRLRNNIREWIGSDQHIAATYTLFRNAMIVTETSDWAAVCLETRKHIGNNLVFIPLHPRRTTSASLVWRKGVVYSPVMKAFLSLLDIQNQNGK